MRYCADCIFTSVDAYCFKLHERCFYCDAERCPYYTKIKSRPDEQTAEKKNTVKFAL